MADTPLTFSQVKGRFRMVDIMWVEPYGDGTGYFLGPDTNRRADDFPFASYPRIYVGKHDPDELIPVKVIHKWLHQLGIVAQPLQQFWEVQDYRADK